MRAPSGPRAARRPTDPTWQRILATTAVVLAVPVALWAASDPLAASLALSTTAALGVAGRRARRLHRCLAECGGVTVALVGDLRVCVTRDGTERAC